MNVGLMAAALFFTAIDAVSFLACGVLMMRFICMYTEEGAKRSRPLLVRILGLGGVCRPGGFGAQSVFGCKAVHIRPAVLFYFAWVVCLP